MEAQVDAFMERFETMWRSPTPEGFAELFHPDGSLKHPSMSEPLPAGGAAAYMRGLNKTLPNLNLQVRNWAAAGDTVLIEYTLSATVDGHTVSWDGADRFTLRGARAIDGAAYFDPSVIGSALAASS